ncbi:MAG: hypothetical protein ACYTKD_11125 [Planctomycetota bacterium]
MLRRTQGPKTSSVVVPEAFAGGTWKRPLAAVAVALLAYGGLTAAFFRSGGRGSDAFVVVPPVADETVAPEWLPPAEAARLNSLGTAVRGRSILDPHLARDLAACYEESPWVSRVLHVRRAHPNRLDVALAIRRPVACVRTSSGPPIILDAEGWRLPASADPAGLVLLTGTVSLPPPPGERWDSIRVSDGLRALGRYSSFVTDDPSRTAFAPVELRVGGWSRPDGRPVIEIVTRRRFPVVWGVDLPGGSASVAGPSAEEKLAALAAALPRLARETRAIAYVSVRHRSGVVLGFRDAAPPGRDGAR